MPPTVILIRHAQALHNATHHSIPDPVLTDLGKTQCAELRENLVKNLPGKLNVELILVSPMRRTLQTALLSVDWLIEKGVPMQAHAGWQECSTHPCDTGSPIAKLKEQFPQVDFSHVDEVYPDKTSPKGSFYAYNKKALLNRAQKDLEELYNRPEKVILVVSHASFLRQAVTGSFFNNADYRIFDIEAPKKAGDPYQTKQWDQTLKTNGGLGHSWAKITQLGEELPDNGNGLPVVLCYTRLTM